MARLVRAFVYAEGLGSRKGRQAHELAIDEGATVVEGAASPSLLETLKAQIESLTVRAA